MLHIKTQSTENSQQMCTPLYDESTRTVLYDRQGKLLYEYSKDVGRIMEERPSQGDY